VGDFKTEGYDNMENGWMIYFIFMCAVIVMQIILLNMVIAMMSDTFSRVKEINE
jgi:hypothetical protein